jgi:broad specificity phosphatase PhoE
MERTQLIIVRHGQTQWNLKLIRQGHLDSPLTEKGIAQAKALGERLMRETFTALYSGEVADVGLNILKLAVPMLAPQPS